MRLEYGEGEEDENEMMDNEGDIDFMVSNNTGGGNDSADNSNMMDIDESS